MVGNYATYMLRCWRRNGVRRVEVIHIQSGRRALVPSLSDALAWLETGAGTPDDLGIPDSPYCDPGPAHPG